MQRIPRFSLQKIIRRPPANRRSGTPRERCAALLRHRLRRTWRLRWALSPSGPPPRSSCWSSPRWLLYAHRCTHSLAAQTSRRVSSTAVPQQFLASASLSLLDHSPIVAMPLLLRRPGRLPQLLWLLDEREPQQPRARPLQLRKLLWPRHALLLEHAL